MIPAFTAMSFGLFLSLSAAAQQEPAAPAATAAVQSLLDDSVRLAKENKGEDALQAAERAVSAAVEAKDFAGEARAQSERALRLTELKRSPKAQEAWQQAGMGWKRLGDGPGQVEALAMLALLLMAEKADEARELLKQSIALARAEKTRPQAAARQLNDLGKSLADLRKPDDALEVFQAALVIQEELPRESLDLAASLNGLGRLVLDKGDPAAAGGHHQRALAIREKLAPDSLDVAASLNNLGVVAENQGDLAAARDYHQRALAIRERLAPGSLDVARSLVNLGVVAYGQGDLTAARDYFHSALAIQEKLAPVSLDMANSLNNLGLVACSQADLTAARDYLQRALAIQEKLAPVSLDMSNSLNNLGLVAWNQGDLAAARDYFHRALAMEGKLAPGSIAMAGSFLNLGAVALHQGDLAAARDYTQRALAIQEKLAPGSLDVAKSLLSLGAVVYEQGDMIAARDFFQRALAIQEKQAPGSLDMAASLNNLGAVTHDQGDLVASRDFYQRAFAIQEKQAPGSLDVAVSLSNLGNAASNQGDLTAAGNFHRRAFAIRERLAPGSLDMATSLNRLGALALDQKDLTAARDFHQRALAIQEKLAPGSLAVAASLNNLGDEAANQGDLTTAAQLATRAWTILREQAFLVSGDEARQAFGGHYAEFGANLVRYQVALKRAEDAFVTLEEGRAQALQQMLLERDTAKRRAPAAVWRAYEEALRAYDLRQKSLEKAGEGEAKATASLAAEIALRAGEEALAAKRQALTAAQKETEGVREGYIQARVEAERRWGEVRQSVRAVLPPPVNVKRARELVSPGVVWIEFSVGEHGSTLFVVQGGRPVAAYLLQVSLKELEARVDIVRRSASREAGEDGAAPAGSVEMRAAAARMLYQKLFPKEARDAITTAKRVVLSPDGVLWELPFSALVINDTGAPRYLGLEKPLSYAQSLAVFAQAVSAEAAGAGGKGTVLVVGNPLFDNARRAEPPATQTKPAGAAVTADRAAQRAHGELALLSRDGSIPEPLPGAEEEARRVAAIYGVKAWRGAEPTEKWFRERAGEAGIIHLATHGYFNPYRALSSGVRLAVPEQGAGPADTDNDGALQAWEILNQLQLKAELVVLSACETGMGAKVKGEGLVGLTRAFQVAGARSVLASQWRVADQSTAELMTAFHKQLRAGELKDEALRRAMAKVAKDPATADPFFWAAFLLVGDYRGK